MKYKNKEEIVLEIVDSLTVAEVELLQEFTKDEMVKFHLSVGMSIRNTYKLWDSDNPLTSLWHSDRKANNDIHMKDGVDYHPNHPDAISGDILDGVWERINKELE